MNINVVHLFILIEKHQNVGGGSFIRAERLVCLFRDLGRIMKVQWSFQLKAWGRLENSCNLTACV